MAVQPIPPGMHTVTPHLVVRGAAKAIDFYKKAFDAKEEARLPGPNGMIMHASIRIGDSSVMLMDESPEWKAVGPLSLRGSPVTIHLYVNDADDVRVGAHGRRETDHADGRHVLGRPLRRGRGSVRPLLVHCDAHARRSGEGNPGGVEEGLDVARARRGSFAISLKSDNRGHAWPPPVWPIGGKCFA